MKIYKVILFVFVIIGVSCKKEVPEINIKDSGKIVFRFSHKIEGISLQKDSMIYVNEAGNHYEINELMYFISDVTLHKNDGTTQLIDDWKDINYVDVNIPSTLTWNVFDSIPTGTYDSISFTFGINTQKNQSFMFVNAPEVNMMWPNVLGGGYHYMMINGKWIDTLSVKQSFAFHLGIGQLYQSNAMSNTDSIYAFVPNYFNVKLPNSAFEITKNKTQEIEIIMNIESWFKTPYVYNHDYWGGAIMQNQAAMQMVKENGVDVFSVNIIK
ncbi:MAG: MbnP family protein [Bacteroidota bacterium]